MGLKLPWSPWWRVPDRWSVSRLILLDLSVAFNTIDHGILLECSFGLGVGWTVLKWFWSFLTGRLQKLVQGDLPFNIVDIDLWGSPGVSVISYAF